MRIIGLDVGQKTIGVAVSDPLGFTAQGLKTIYRKNKEQSISEVIELCKEYNPTTIVVGLPKNMNGTMGPACERIMNFCEDLKKSIDIKIELWDERLTTVEATRAMLEADLSRSKRKKIVDKVAATYILQGYLDKIARQKK